MFKILVIQAADALGAGPASSRALRRRESCRSLEAIPQRPLGFPAFCEQAYWDKEAGARPASNRLISDYSRY
jgi:hypothetical protein